MSKYLPHPEMNNILAKRSAELRKQHCYSTWFYDEEPRDILICTTRPGLWIGPHGKDIESLQKEINEVASKHNIEPVIISFIECNS